MTISPPTIAPHSLEAEQAVLGAILQDNQAMPKAMELLVEEDFYRTAHRKVYRAMRELADTGAAIDQITLTACLKGRSELEAVGGATYLAELLTTVATAANIRHHCQIITRLARQRERREQLLMALHAIDTGADQEQLDGLISDLKAETTGPLSSTAVPWQNSAIAVRTAPPEPPWLIHGLIPAQSVLLFSGREGTMKTWIALDWSYSVAEGRPWLAHEAEAGAVCYVDAENPGRLFLARLFAVGTSPNLNIMRWQDIGFPTSLSHPTMLRAAREHQLVVIDTLRRFMEGLDENSSTDMALITTKLRHLTKWGATVLVLHHGKKDAENGGYRGSTELGAAVDITMDVEKKKVDGQTHLFLSVNKTRFSNDPRIVLSVEHTPARPQFRNVTGHQQQAKAATKEADLQRLQAIMVDIGTKAQRDPIQAEIVDAAVDIHLASRNTIVKWLRDGEPERWVSKATGRTRSYRPQKPTQPTILKGGVDWLDQSKSSSPTLPAIDPTTPGGAIKEQVGLIDRGADSPAHEEVLADEN